LSTPLAFVLFLVLTLALLGAVVWSGFAGRRRTHLALVIGAVASLGVTIFFAEKLGESYDLATAGRITPIHLFIAKVTTLAYLLPIASGVRLWFRPGGRALHRVLAFTVLAMTLVTALTGTAMVLMSDRKPLAEQPQAPLGEDGAFFPGRTGSSH
jgi:hypothetical protein